MIIAVLSDIHGNPWALQETISLARERYGSEVRFCIVGDVIGYGPRPLGCIRLIKQLDDEGVLYRDPDGRAALVAGNHEAAWQSYDQLPRVAQELERIAQIPLLHDRQADIIRLGRSLHRLNHTNGSARLNLPQIQALLFNMLDLRTNPGLTDWFRMEVIKSNFQKQVFSAANLNGWTKVAVHGSLNEPLEENLRETPSYLNRIDRYMKLTCSAICKKNAIFINGHTHVPMWFSSDRPQAHDIVYDQPMPLSPEITLLNPGSVGLPRDYDCRPSFLVLDLRPNEATVEFIRAENGYMAGRNELLQVLADEGYPEVIQSYFQTAKYTENARESHDVIEYLKILKKRAGHYWCLEHGDPDE